MRFGITLPNALSESNYLAQKVAEVGREPVIHFSN
jgi:hypothetical protein